jgi:hypothetical protein
MQVILFSGLWTPPYNPDLQPIKLFLGIGKNYAAAHNNNTNHLRDVVASLQDGWYGHNYIFDDNIRNININTGLLRLNNDKLHNTSTAIWVLTQNCYQLSHERNKREQAQRDKKR